MKNNIKKLLVILSIGLITLGTAVARDYLNRSSKIITEAEYDAENNVQGGDAQGQIIRLLLGAEDTEGQFSLFSDTHPEAGATVRAHKHEWHDEAFYIVRGRYEVLNGELGDEWVEVEEGAALYSPRGTVHSFRALEDNSKFIVFYTPGGWENFYIAYREALATRSEEELNDPELVAEFLRSYDEIFVE